MFRNSDPEWWPAWKYDFVCRIVPRFHHSQHSFLFFGLIRSSIGVYLVLFPRGTRLDYSVIVTIVAYSPNSETCRIADRRGGCAAWWG